MRYVRYNFVGGMLPFGAGLLAARYLRLPHVDVSRFHWLFRFAVVSASVVAGCFSFHTWLWVPLAVCVAAVCLVKSVPERWLLPMEWIGTVSAAMFVIHPVFRKIFIPISQRGEVYDGLLLYVITTVAFSWLLQQVMDRMKMR